MAVVAGKSLVDTKFLIGSDYDNQNRLYGEAEVRELIDSLSAIAQVWVHAQAMANKAGPFAGTIDLIGRLDKELFERAKRAITSPPRG